jgi:peptidoglycan/LPS O-acetylase OafA/YrhL
MSPVNPIFAFIATMMALTTAYVFSKFFGVSSEKNRFLSIDGLRGYLAFFVFIHHIASWFFYLRGKWNCPSKLYHFLGPTSSVSLFFMITGFLFFSKIIDAKDKPIDWLKLYVSRILRLTPLYFFMLAILLFIVACLSNFSLKESCGTLIMNIGRWAVFVVLGRPDINRITDTYSIIAGVNWTLAYEWLFYLMLPMLALLMRRTTTIPGIILSIFVIPVSLFCNHSYPLLFVAFLGGIIAAFLNKNDYFRMLARSKVSSFVAIMCLLLAVLNHDPNEHLFVFRINLIIPFILIACGNTLFGALTISPARFLGEISYSIYLLHGIFLFVIFKFIIGTENASSMSPLTHWALIIGCLPFFLFICCLTFKWIESPFLKSVTPVTAWIRSFSFYPRWFPEPYKKEQKRE